MYKKASKEKKDMQQRRHPVVREWHSNTPSPSLVEPMVQPLVQPVVQPSIKNEPKWMYWGSLLAALLFGLLLGLLWMTKKVKEAREKKNNIGDVSWSNNTRALLRVGSTIALQSITSGRFLTLLPEKEAMPNCDQIAEANLLLQATSEDKEDPATQWEIRDVSSVQTQFPHAVRIFNKKYETYLREVINPVSDFPGFTWQAGTGAGLGSAMFATHSDHKAPDEVLIIGADIALLQQISNVNEDTPFFLSSDREGRILSPGKVPFNRYSVWKIHVIA